ncbi:ribose 5-phosphate isomerase A [Candidatus Hodarchaeum mangrovi]
MVNEKLLERIKQTVAEQAVKDNLEEGMVVGVGSGSTIIYAINMMGQMNRELGGLDIVCIPTSHQSSQLITQNKLKIGSLTEYPELDIVIDGVDEIDSHLNAIKGGGGCLLQEKIVASNTNNFIVVLDYKKRSFNLGTNWKNGVPIEIHPIAFKPLMTKFIQLGGKPTLRQGIKKLGPVITDNGNFIVDVNFGLIENPESLNAKLKAIPGVLETGFFIQMISTAYIGEESGKITIEKKKRN